MTAKTDAELLASYSSGGAGAEAAFAEIVRRHGGLVYAACRRLLGDAAAEDAVQAVFMLLAQKAGSLSRGEALAGWLYGAASLVAREHLRSAHRRERAEREGAAMREAEKAGAAGPSWSELRPEIDAALGALPRQYRDAVVLSCMEGKPEADVARELGVRAGTVKSRVSRGLERLRERLGQRGVVTSVAALAVLLGAHGAEAMPAALAANVAALGVSGAVIGSGSAASLMMEGAMKAMFWIKVKLAAVVMVGAAAVGGGGAAVVIAAAEPAVPKAESSPAEASAKAGPKPKAESPNPVPAEAGKVAWGEAVGGLQAGLVPLGGVAVKDWPEPFLCVKCREFGRMLVTSKCGDCGAECNSNRKLQLCASCAAKKRVCQACGAAKPWGATFAQGEPLAFEIHLKNVGDAALQLHDAGYSGIWRLEFKSQADSKIYRPQPMFDDSRAGPMNINLDKGRSSVVLKAVAAPNWKFRADGGAGPVDALPAGKYTVIASYKHPVVPEAKPTHFWHGNVTTGAVEIEIKAKGAAAAGDWQKLFADEGWYKNQAGAEQVFTGTLEGVKPPENSALMRDSLYKLGDRNIYTGAKKVAALDGLVGKKVEIRGKAVDMNLEGQNLKEIWPASVREAGAAAGGAPVKLDPKQEIRGELPAILPVGPPVQLPGPGVPGKP